MKQDIVIVGGARTPMCEYVGTAGFGKFKDMSALQLGAHASKAAIERSGVDPASIDHVVMGNVLQSSVDALYGARHIALMAGVPEHVPALTVNRLCGSGIQSVINAAQLIQLGEATTVLAGGTENMSQAPYVLYGARNGFPLGMAPEMKDSLFASLYDPIAESFMAQTAERIARRLSISREDQDAFAYASQQKAAAAVKAGTFKDEIVPVHGVRFENNKRVLFDFDAEEMPRADTTLEGLAQLRPVFAAKGSVTAGNASPLSDGAAAALVMTKAKADALGVKPLGYFRSFATAGVDPTIMGIGPIPAVKRLFEKTGKTMADIDLVELNEAFASQSIYVQRTLEIPDEKLNVHGGAIALGHPLGCTGAKLTATALHELRRRKGKYAIVTMCIGGGMGAAGLFEAA
ncbi:MAG: thiolase family protein [Myxococcales bacterium]|nr:thiolase family protein [Myxococcales bacterium]